MTKLKPCLGCGRELDPAAKICPNCGRPNSTGMSVAKKAGIGCLTIVGLFLLVTFILGAASSQRGTPSASTPTASEPTVVVSAEQLFHDYDENEAAADLKYKGHPVQVTGEIESIDKDVMGVVVVKLKTPQMFVPIHARLDSASTSKAASLRKRDVGTFKCVGGTRIARWPTLHDCWF